MSIKKRTNFCKKIQKFTPLFIQYLFFCRMHAEFHLNSKFSFRFCIEISSEKNTISSQTLKISVETAMEMSVRYCQIIEKKSVIQQPSRKATTQFFNV